jgi:hypothetical protein
MIAKETFVPAIPFRQLPLAARIAVGVTFFNTWMCIEEFIIDRYGLWQYMPYYRRADPCLWDLAVASLIVVAIWRASRTARPLPHASA